MPRPAPCWQTCSATPGPGTLFWPPRTPRRWRVGRGRLGGSAVTRRRRITSPQRQRSMTTSPACGEPRTPTHTATTHADEQAARTRVIVTVPFRSSLLGVNNLEINQLERVPAANTSPVNHPDSPPFSVGNFTVRGGRVSKTSVDRRD